jgi:hypothetical protein
MKVNTYMLVPSRHVKFVLIPFKAIYLNILQFYITIVHSFLLLSVFSQKSTWYFLQNGSMRRSKGLVSSGSAFGWGWRRV